VEKPLSVTGDTQPLVVVTQPEIDTGVTEAMARALQKASAKKTEADAEALIETQLTARRDELRSLQSTRPTPEQVEVSVMARLVAMANDL
jgi:SOS-response transcriptional repressor LexA